MNSLFATLDSLEVSSILDCACGLGTKTALLAKHGYDVEGADASPIAAHYAPKLATAEGLCIRFLHARNEELGQVCSRTYDCVYSDGFDELATREELVSSAKGIYEVLTDGGVFVFAGVDILATHSDVEACIQREWRERVPFNVSQPIEREGIRLINLEIDEKTPEGILEKRVFLIEEKGVLRCEIAFMMNRRKWTHDDFVEVLKEAGFRCVITEVKASEHFTVAAK